ncbi:MAG: OmpA family protein [Deltaproteobacteria bacterium]|nr:OmpA family protein [Deltaproteobacteria bacterium]
MIRSLAIVTVMSALAACGPKAAPVAPTEPAPAAPADPAAPTDPATPAEPAAHTPATSFQIEDNHLVLPSPVAFATGSADVDPSAEAALWFAKDYLDAKDYITTLRIEVHTSSDTPDGQALSEARALAVGHWLIAHGIACDRLIAVGFGDNKPIADGSTPDGRAANRRVEFHNAELRGRLIGGMPADGGGMVAGDLCAH